MTAGAPTIGGLKRLSLYLAGQLSSNVNITGGTISGVSVSLPANAKGTFIMNGTAAVTAATAAATPASAVATAIATVGGTPGFFQVVAGTGQIVVTGTAGDTSTYNYRIIN